MTELRGYAASIAKATGIMNADDLADIEDSMRNDIFHSTLDWQSPAVFAKGARDAWEIVQIMRDPAQVAAILGMVA